MPVARASRFILSEELFCGPDSRIHGKVPAHMGNIGCALPRAGGSPVDHASDLRFAPKKIRWVEVSVNEGLPNSITLNKDL